jgi:ketosteroid isomerase-like protein
MATIDQINQLGEDFWKWRAAQQPRSHDDIPRLERPNGWIPRWSAADVTRYRTEVAEFEKRYASIDVGPVGSPKVSLAEWIDHRLLGSALARVRWEMDHLRLWETHARFYIDQTIGAIFDYLTPLHIDAKTITDVRRILSSFSSTLSEAKKNIAGKAYKELVNVCIHDLGSIEEQMETMGKGLLTHVASAEHDAFMGEARTAAKELASYRDWLKANLDSFPGLQVIGREKFIWFLKNVALCPLSPEKLRDIGNLEFERAIYLETLFTNRYKKSPLPPLPSSAAEQSANEARLEQQVRDFYESQNLLSQPSTMKHYLNAPRPDYLEAIRWLGVTDDLTGPSRLDVDGVSYVPAPKPDMPYFYAANARDPRAGIVHEGAHYQQLAISWRNPRPIRRHYYDSGVNEGIAFYNEEMMLAAGLFDDAPHSQTLMYNFMRLRALRVIIDVALATGEMDLETAAQFLAEKVPMDVATAREEAVFFAGFPGQGLTYQIGKTQIITLMSDQIRTAPKEFSLRSFHDFLWQNGNVPISLLRLELLNDWNDIAEVDGVNEEAIKAELWANVRTMFDAFLSKDREFANSFIADDVTLWDSVERDLVVTLDGLNQLRDRRPAPTPTTPKVVAINPIKPHITVHGDIAIVRYEFTVEFDQGLPPELIRNTAVWRRAGGRWQVIHNHEDVISE